MEAFNTLKIDTAIIVYEFGKLKSVIYHSDLCENEPFMISAIQLIFENGEVYHEALTDTDEISCADILRNKYNRVQNITKSKLWSECIDKNALWIWNLKNQQNYNDGI